MAAWLEKFKNMTMYLKNYKLKSVFSVLLLSLSFILTAQKQHVNTSEFFGLTIDVIMWDDVEYMCSESPLSFFRDYKSIFGELTTNEYNPELPVDLDKNYKVKWFINGTGNGSGLYIYDIEVLDGGDNYPDKRIPIENLTHQKFNNGLNSSGISINEFPEGVMLALWFNGFI